MQYNTIQYNTIQYNTIQYNTIHYNTIQYNILFENNYITNSPPPFGRRPSHAARRTQPTARRPSHAARRTPPVARHLSGTAFRTLRFRHYVSDIPVNAFLKQDININFEMFEFSQLLLTHHKTIYFEVDYVIYVNW